MEEKTQDQIIDELFKESLRSKKWIQLDGKIINVDKILYIGQGFVKLIDGTAIDTKIPFSVFESYCAAGEINLNAGLVTE
ncbi:hypothetical protein SJDPG2_02275 [Porphyromonas gingivalis SJD2]|mgnify:FL=1|uniref:Uncharacterized protein n=3 Tax=Viruses TaxID=10239 RepID=A0AAT9J8M0_9CAUD|nr:hypothetical protein [Porphyromonas gingivalis]ETA27743.1 hypothetical protein SJDPG2_02275 [Porphyromonas gingivalis SJD2]OWR78071.1 hypothetical protein SJDPG5_01035 [Porphyromonas gingivalis SJD5]PDP66819.1 hypothetical protein CLI78_02105 [Porphyromonas gingivalis]